MSEQINNREYRQKVLKEIIGELHKGKSVDEVKPRFEKLIKGISTSEITEMEQALIMEGMPVEEIQRLCDVHAAVFKGSIEEIHNPQSQEEIPGHPVHTFKLENRALEELLNNRIITLMENFKSSDSQENVNLLLEEFETLSEIDKHYSRKENLLFPYLEKYGITAPPKVMWGVDDEIRDAIKEAKELIANYSGDKNNIVEKVNNVVKRLNEMIYKEEKILLPMALETLTEDEWLKIAEESEEIGYFLVKPEKKWKPARANLEKKAQEENKLNEEDCSDNNLVKFDAGVLSQEEINAIFNTLPLDITFVDKDGHVKYFSQGKERIFARPKTVLGRHVTNCHPPASVGIVNQIVEELKSGKKEHEDFWIKMGNKYVFIRYFAVRNQKGEFLGIMEVTQDIKPIQDITGEKRLISET
ncbi:MAG TPA: DUF438 domain-containing protein [Clostridiaceae bacterium]|nr:DUF438 domain-containing protein [Clostridiaceae bacterium]